MLSLKDSILQSSSMTIFPTHQEEREGSKTVAVTNVNFATDLTIHQFHFQFSGKQTVPGILIP